LAKDLRDISSLDITNAALPGSVTIAASDANALITMGAN
jgi:hypothetical protein